MTLYERIKKMSFEEMKAFMYWVYLSRNKDGAEDLQDSPNGYFGGNFLTLDAKDVIKNDDFNSLFDYNGQMLLDKVK